MSGAAVCQIMWYVHRMCHSFARDWLKVTCVNTVYCNPIYHICVSLVIIYYNYFIIYYFWVCKWCQWPSTLLFCNKNHINKEPEHSSQRIPKTIPSEPRRWARQSISQVFPSARLVILPNSASTCRETNFSGPIGPRALVWRVRRRGQPLKFSLLT